VSHWRDSLPNLSIEELEELIAELGQIAVLTRELNAKLLMAALPSLKRDLALVLVSVDRSTRGSTEDPIAKDLLQVFLRHQPTMKELGELRIHCSEWGAKCWSNAVGYYLKDPVRQGAESIGQELMLQALKRQQEAEAAGGEYTDEQAQQDAEAAAEALEGRMRLRAYLRDELGIESAEDWRMMKDALVCVSKKYKDLWQQGSRETLNALTREAKRLMDRARSMNSTPSKLTRWAEQKAKGLSANVVYQRPDGVYVWGSGELVIWDKDGTTPRRPMDTIFGKTMPEGSVPLDFEMDQMVNEAFRDDDVEI
jgi:hypothetical protein